MMNRFLAGLMVFGFCVAIAIPSPAQAPPAQEKKASAQNSLTPEKMALIKELMKLMNASTNTEAFTNQFFEQLQISYVTLISQGLLEDIPQQKLSPDEQKRLKSEADEAAQRVLARFRTEFPKRINLVEVLDQAGFEMYGKHFTEGELKELVTLYKSPTLQKLVRLLPQILAESIPKIEELVTPAITRIMGELISEEKKTIKTR